VLAFAAAKNNDKVGLVIFTDQIELYIPPKKGSRHVLRVIRELLAFEMPKRKTDIPMALDYVARVLRKKATVFLVSDFIETNFKKPLGLLNRRHDVIAVPVRDRVEMAMPNIGLIELQDAETGEIIMIDTSSSTFRSQYSDSNTQNFDSLKSMMRSINVDSIPIYTDKPYVQDLVQFFHMRHGRR
ncbi:MAG: VWA domain-containing protein, partial [Phycisphaeraceae bacterium]|nr:VWA domain-containing protein [Phycisphaeraceae bacterium]